MSQMFERFSALNRTMECIRRTIAADLNPGPKRSSAPGRVEVMKKLAVSFTRRPAVSLDSVPVSAMGRAEYLFMKVAMKAPRMTKGE